MNYIEKFKFIILDEINFEYFQIPNIYKKREDYF